VTTKLKAGSGTITLSADGGELGTVFPSAAGDYTITDATDSAGSGTVSTAPSLSGADATVTFTVPKAIKASASLTVAVSGVLNPPLASSSQTISVSTSADTGAVASSTYSITASADGSGIMAVTPTVVAPSTATTLTFTYTAADGGLSSGAITIAVPSNWPAPWPTSGHAGFTTASTGTVSVSGQTISVSGVTLATNATLTVTYGSGGGTNSATSPATAANATFAIRTPGKGAGGSVQPCRHEGRGPGHTKLQLLEFACHHHGRPESMPPAQQCHSVEAVSGRPPYR
jgi:hypothetical protein